MTSKCFSANGPGGPIKEIVITILSKRTVVGYVPLKAGIRLDMQPFLVLHAKVAPTILVKMPMRRPSNDGKSNVVSKELSTTEEAVERIQRPEDIPLKPPGIISKNQLP